MSDATTDRAAKIQKALTEKGRWYQWGFRDAEQGLTPSRNIGFKVEYRNAYDRGYNDAMRRIRG